MRRGNFRIAPFAFAGVNLSCNRQSAFIAGNEARSIQTLCHERSEEIFHNRAAIRRPGLDIGGIKWYP